MANSSARSGGLSAGKRLLGLLALVAVIGVSMVAGFALSGGLHGQPADAEDAMPVVALAIGLVIFGVFVGALGVSAFAIAYATNGLTSNFAVPILKASARRLWVLKIIITFLIGSAVALVVGAMLLVLLSRFMAQPTALGVSFFVPFIIMQFVFAWWQVMAPIEMRLVRRRMQARGISEQSMASGRIVGVSDPSQNSMKKLSTILNDVGVLWITESALTFMGDERDWSIRHEQLLEIERKADPGATSSYFGAVHVVLRCRNADGGEARVRLHAEGVTTMTGSAHGLDEIAARLMAWQASPSSGWSIPAGTPAPAAPPPIPAQ